MRAVAWVIPFLAVRVATCAGQSAQLAPASGNGSAKTVRVCATESARSSIDWHLQPSEVLAAVDRSLNELEQLVHRAGASGCDALALPEDTLGVLHWEMGNKASMNEVLPSAVARMLERLGRAAAAPRLYLVCSARGPGPDGSPPHTASLFGSH